MSSLSVGGMNGMMAFPAMQAMALNPQSAGMMGMALGGDSCQFSGMMGEAGGMGMSPMMSMILGGGNAAGQDYFTMMAQQILAAVGNDPSLTSSMFAGMPSTGGMDMSSMMGGMGGGMDMSSMMGGMGGGMNLASLMGGMGGGMDFSSLLSGMGGGMDFSSLLGGSGGGMDLGSLMGGGGGMDLGSIGDSIGSLF